MRPTETLMEEHRLILLVIAQAEQEAERIEQSGSVDEARVGKMLDFFRNFADRCHHGKEEDHLFKLLQHKPPARGPVAVMLQEHEIGRGFLRRTQEGLEALRSGRADGATQVVEGLRGYSELLRAHIDKENYVLFPMADQILAPAEQERLAAVFARVEEEEIGQGVHQRYEELAHALGRASH